MPRIYDRLLALTEEAITTLRTIQETQVESQRNAMASRAANDSVKAFYDSQRGAGDELPRLRQDLAKARRVQAERDAALLREKAETVQPVGLRAVSTAAVMCWCAYLIDTDDETPMTLREWLNGRGKS